MKKTAKTKLSEETIRCVTDLAEILQKIHSRMAAEGKIKVVDGKIIFLK